MRLFLITFFCVGFSLVSYGLANTKPESGPEIEKFQYECVDFHRRPVLNVRNDSLNDVAFSDMMRMRGIVMGPMIILNIKRLKQLSKASQIFFVMHECGHHVLGHLYVRKPGLETEQEADCYAVRKLIRSGRFTLKDIQDVQTDMRKFAKASFYHKGGAARADALMQCIES